MRILGINRKKSNCSGCTACIYICPRKALSMQKDEEGFCYPERDDFLCNRCGKCSASCPFLNPQNVHEKLVRAVAYKNKNEKLRHESSSGGIFIELAKKIIASGGAVYGAAMGRDLKVRHIRAEKNEQLKLLHGSKYVESYMGNIIADVLKDLDTGKNVLFSGTPCQGAAVRTAAEGRRDKLIIVDLICHGVPGAELFEHYIRERAGNRLIKNVKFRDKNQEHAYGMTIEYKNGAVENSAGNKDSYMRAFMFNLSLRPSCGDCKMKGLNGYSDITIGDCHSCKDVLPDFFDGEKKGVSLVFVKTEPGGKLFESVSDTGEIKIIEDYKILKNDIINICESVKHHKKRGKFYKIIKKNGAFGKFVDKYLGKTR